LKNKLTLDKSRLNLPNNKKEIIVLNNYLDINIELNKNEIYNKLQGFVKKENVKQGFLL